MSAKLFTDLGLSAESLKAIARLGFEQPSPIQAEAIPPLLAGRDLVGQSQTGSGKTAAFALPAIERIIPTDRSVQVLILCNTRELAVQVSEEIHKLAYFKPGVRPLPIYGGQSYDRQISGLRAGANLVIGTPGRVMDHMQRGTLVLGRVRTVILDEADEMLNMGFRDDIEFILKAVPPDRQTVLFSATIPRPIEDLIARYTKTPLRIHIEAKALTVPTVEQAYVEVDRRWKAEALERLIDLHDVTRGLIFCNTQRMVDELTEVLNAAGYGADSIHGGMAQAQRDRVMKKFKGGGLEFLVATDVAARGIDVDDIQVVFNYDMPYDGEDYVHRVGRTGRAGRSGLAISFASGREVFAIQQIERFTRQRLRRIQVPTHGEIEEARLNQLVQSVRATITAGNFRHYDHLIEGLLEEGIDSLDLANALLHRLSGAGSEGADNSDRKPAKKIAAPGVAVAVPSTTTAVAPVARPAVKPAAIPSAPTAPVKLAENPTPNKATPPLSIAKVRPAAPAPALAPSAAPAMTSPKSGHVLAPPPRPTAVPTPASIPAPAPVPPSPRVTPVPSGSAPVLARKPLPSIPPPPAAAMRDRRDFARPVRDDRAPRAFAAPPSFTETRQLRTGRPTPPAPVERAPRTSAPPGEGLDERSSRRPEREMPPVPKPAAVKASRPGPEADMTRLWLGIGTENQVGSDEIKGCILGETGLPPESVGVIDVRERHAFVDVSAGHAAGILAKLNRTSLGGRKLKAKTA